MFSLFRCLFWLGVVFSQIAALEGTDTTAFVRQATLGAGLGQRATQGLIGTTLDAAGKKCAAAPETCLTLAKGLTGKSSASRDSLNTSDRIPAWRLRTGRLDEENAIH
jgi:hypothetical protein